KRPRHPGGTVFSRQQTVISGLRDFQNGQLALAQLADMDVAMNPLQNPLAASFRRSRCPVRVRPQDGDPAWIGSAKPTQLTADLSVVTISPSFGSLASYLPMCVKH